ncbi:hypothetical protein AKJ41_04960 [candidate division MSBL1 archaeon SCGC-AAA259O05]|uniref:Uncharacterized protein n=1 Tax=candidate division MSBL1 archaeon SCGC-AAA259O05 TaxID=1698271 RepID=A0A133UZX4_9EURY|nr:hypothetical protein AKJ41_04960 [candidate division MSBL1 archaeon SCGC-AAA259O05]
MKKHLLYGTSISIIPSVFAAMVVPYISLYSSEFLNLSVDMIGIVLIFSSFINGDEWRFYMILKDKIEDEPSDRDPEVVKEKGEKIENQYGPGLPRHR